MIHVAPACVHGSGSDLSGKYPPYIYRDFLLFRNYTNKLPSFHNLLNREPYTRGSVITNITRYNSSLFLISNFFVCVCI